MKTRLLKKLRKKAKNKFFPVLLERGMVISTYDETGYRRLNLTYGIGGSSYAWVNQYTPCWVYDTQKSIQKMLNRVRRDFIIEYVKNEKEQRRLNNEFNKIK
jgi:hypothetical protein